jgi:hypothetical protein
MAWIDKILQAEEVLLQAFPVSKMPPPLILEEKTLPQYLNHLPKAMPHSSPVSL